MPHIAAPLLDYSLSNSSFRPRRVPARVARVRYYKVGHGSRVDQSLFGPSHREAPDPGTRCVQSTVDEAERKFPHKPVCVQVLSNDHVRSLVVPVKDDPMGKSTIIHCADFERLKNAARVVSKEEREEIAEMHRMEQEKAAAECQERRHKAQVMERHRLKDQKLTDLEEDEIMKSELLVRKATEQRQEDEDEIKKLNQMVLGAKCIMVRDKQVIENKKILKEKELEDKRLNNEMEIDRLNAVKIEETIDNKRKSERLLGAMVLMEQIALNQQEKLLDLERKDKENKALKGYVDHLCEEELSLLGRRNTMQRELRRDLDECVLDVRRQKTLAKEQDRLLSERVLKAQKEKEERDIAFENETKRKRLEREQEIDRMRRKQENRMNLMAQHDALAARRAQEEAERDWRKRQQSEAWKKTHTEDLLNRARNKQQEEKNHALDVEIQRDRVDFECVLKKHQEIIEKGQRETEMKRKKSLQCLVGLQKQIREKQEERIEKRRDVFEEGLRIIEETKRRRQKLNEVKSRKLNELRAMGVDEKYVRLVDNRMTHFKFP